MSVFSRFASGAASLGGVLVLAACAPVTPPPGQFASAPGGQCFFPSTITGFKTAGATAVNVRSSTQGVYRVDLAAPCDLRSAEKVLLDSRSSGASVCPGADVVLIASTAAGPRSCPGRSVRKLAEAEVSALPAAERP